MFFLLVSLFEEFHAAKAGDAVIEMDDEIAFLQFEEGIDGTGFDFFPGRRGPDIATAEEFVVAEHDEAIFHESEAMGDMSEAELQTIRGGEIGFGEEFGEAFEFSLVVTGENDGLIELDDLGKLLDGLVGGGFHAFDGFDAEMAGGFVGTGGEGAEGDGGVSDGFGEGGLDPVEATRIVESGEVLAAFRRDVRQIA